MALAVGTGLGSNIDMSLERQMHNKSGQRSPLSLRRSPNQISKHQTMSLRKLTNSLFEDGVSMFTGDNCDVIKEEDDKERDEEI